MGHFGPGDTSHLGHFDLGTHRTWDTLVFGHIEPGTLWSWDILVLGHNDPGTYRGVHTFLQYAVSSAGCIITTELLH